MLYIVCLGHPEVKWHVGEQFHIDNEEVEVDYIHAYGDEVEYIRNHFTNIPMSDKPVQRWYGDIAKTIAYGLIQMSV